MKDNSPDHPDHPDTTSPSEHPDARESDRTEHDANALKYPHEHPAHAPWRTGVWLGALLLGTFAYFGGMAWHEAAQTRNERERDAILLTGGNPSRGRQLLRPYGCAQCHTIPGIAGSNGTVGPPLAGIATRMYVGGVVTNSPSNLVRWIMNPQAIDPMSAMPATGVSEAQARDIAAYLYTLR